MPSVHGCLKGRLSDLKYEFCSFAPACTQSHQRARLIQQEKESVFRLHADASNCTKSEIKGTPTPILEVRAFPILSAQIVLRNEQV